MKVTLENRELSNSISLIQPTCPILCTTKNEDNSDHVAPFSWFIPVSRKPPRVALALLSNPRKQHSLVNIERTGEFVVNIPDISLAEKIMQCGSPSKLGINKFERSGFTILPSEYVEVNGIEECKANIECKLYDLYEVGDHKLIIADVLNCKYDTDFYNKDLTPNYNIFTPAVYLGKINSGKDQLHGFIETIDIHNIEV